jgi:hypothetical protein
MNILKGFQNTAWSFPTVELIPMSGFDDGIQSELIMFGDDNTKKTWVPAGKRSGSPAHLADYYEEDKMRNQSFQHFNMDELVNQSEFENNSKIDNGTDGVFDGDIIPSKWYDMVVGFSIDNGDTPTSSISLKKNRIGIVGTSHSTSDVVVKQVKEILSNYSPVDTEIVSGGANGVDSIAEELALSMGFKVTVYNAETQNWTGYKKRNLQIASRSTKVYCVVLPQTDEPCKHCRNVYGKPSNHKSSGGCYTGVANGNYEVKVAN